MPPWVTLLWLASALHRKTRALRSLREAKLNARAIWTQLPVLEK